MTVRPPAVARGDEVDLGRGVIGDVSAVSKVLRHADDAAARAPVSRTECAVPAPVLRQTGSAWLIP